MREVGSHFLLLDLLGVDVAHSEHILLHHLLHRTCWKWSQPSGNTFLRVTFSGWLSYQGPAVGPRQCVTVGGCPTKALLGSASKWVLSYQGPHGGGGWGGGGVPFVCHMWHPNSGHFKRTEVGAAKNFPA